MADETCVCCGATPTASYNSQTGAKLADTHKWVAVLNKKDLPEGREALHTSELFASVPVCDECHQNPNHRKTPLKGHFFSRQASRRATVLAGSDDLGG